MSEDWMPVVKFPLAWEQFFQLPRNPAYKYEYFDGQAYLTPRPKHFHAILDLRLAEIDPEVKLGPVRAEDFAELEQVFAGAFHLYQPFGGLDDNARRDAARQCLERTRTGKDGPWIESASFVALDEHGRLSGAILITLLPDGDPCSWHSYHWTESPPPDCVERRLGRAHLTWVFVGPWYAGQGIGTALLGAAVNALLELGYRELHTTFLLGNDRSTLWHWRNGFRLLTYPGSSRLMKRERNEL